jgi:hypothetical protein
MRACALQETRLEGTFHGCDPGIAAQCERRARIGGRAAGVKLDGSSVVGKAVDKIECAP